MLSLRGVGRAVAIGRGADAGTCNECAGRTRTRLWKLRGTVVGVIACTAALAQASQAPAATTLGEAGSGTVPCDGPASYVQTTTGPPPAYAVPPGGGVITAWSTEAGSTGGAQVRLAVLRATGAPNQFATIAASAAATLKSGSLNSFATSLSPQAGDVLGLLIVSGTHTCVRTNTGSDDDRGAREVGTVFDVGTIGTYTDPSAPGRRLNLAATLEADADGDGIGDEPPQTKITKGAPKKTDKSKVKFKFSSDDPGANFECKLDKKPYKACTSPKTVKRLDEGKHKFAVRAVDADGHRDASPPKDKFKVVD